MQSELEAAKSLPKLRSSMTMAEGTQVNLPCAESPDVGKSRRNVLRSEASVCQNSLNLNLSHSIDEIRNQQDLTQLLSTN